MDFPLADADSDDVLSTNLKPPYPLNQGENENKEEKARIITQIIELQNTLEDLSRRVESVKDESSRLRSENHVLGKYIQSLMSSSSLFQNTNSTKQHTSKYGD